MQNLAIMFLGNIGGGLPPPFCFSSILRKIFQKIMARFMEGVSLSNTRKKTDDFSPVLFSHFLNTKKYEWYLRAQLWLVPELSIRLFDVKMNLSMTLKPCSSAH